MANGYTGKILRVDLTTRTHSVEEHDDAFYRKYFGGRALVGGTINAVAKASAGSQAVLTPVGRLIGEPDFGPFTRTVIGTGEGLLFGFGLGLGLTRRPS